MIWRLFEAAKPQKRIADSFEVWSVQQRFFSKVSYERQQHRSQRQWH
jgi:hypothetical protein